MSKFKHILDRVTVLESELDICAHALATELGRPVSRRDFGAARTQWDRMQLLLTRTHDAMRAFRSVSAPSLRTGASRSDIQCYRALKKVRQRLALRNRIKAVIADQLRPRRFERPVFPRHKCDAAQTVEDVVQDIFADALHRLANPHGQSDGASDYGCYADIALPMRRFTGVIVDAYRTCLALRHPRPLSFLDVGCGGGTKVLAATACFERCEGLDYDPAYVAAGQAMLSRALPGRGRIFEADAITFDGYEDYSVIYFFRPMQDKDLMLALERQILAKATPHTVLVAPFGIVSPLQNAAEIGPWIYVTGINTSEADALRVELDHIGPDVIVTRVFDAQSDGYWLPLLEASAGNGYVM